MENQQTKKIEMVNETRQDGQIIEDITQDFARKKLPVILASGSKVRKEMLTKVGIPFTVCVSDVDETPDESLSLEDQFKDISKRKATKVMEETTSFGDRIIVAADQNIIFEGTSYGKPANKEEAFGLIHSFLGKRVQAYVGNCVLFIKNGIVMQEICETDIATLEVANISDEELRRYVEEVNVCSFCGGIHTTVAPFVKLVEGRRSTAEGMTLQFLRDILGQ